MKNFCVKEHSCKSVTLKQNTVRVGQKALTYRLLATTKEPCEFLVMLSEGNGISLAKSLGKELTVAETVYALLVKHTVTPCHLAEIVEDLLEDLAPSAAANICR